MSVCVQTDKHINVTLFEVTDAAPSRFFLSRFVQTLDIKPRLLPPGDSNPDSTLTKSSNVVKHKD